MKIAIAKAYNGVHKQFARHVRNQGHHVRYFDIDGPEWPDKARRADGDVYVWNADDKYEDRHLILDRVFFIEKYLNRPVFPDLNMYYPFNDKIKQDQLLKFLGVPRIPTFITFDKDKALKKARETEYPVVVKDVHSFGGKGVFKIESRKELKKMIEKIFSSSGFVEAGHRIKNYLYLQEFISGMDRDLRVITIGGEVAAAYWRIAPAGEWRTNLTGGGEASFRDIPEAAKNMCLDISRKLGYHWMSYDLIVKGDKMYVVELSPVFGVEGPKQAGMDIRKKQMEYIISTSGKKNKK